jgi:ABC-type multidrug transport system permease subunit
LVLVAGVAQVGLGVGQALLAVVPPSGRRRGWQLLVYNVANAAVLLGTLTESVSVVVAGGVLLLLALALFLAAARHPRTHSWPLAIYRILLAILGVSVPVGIVLSALPHS